jgi:hypothetical protein
LKYFIALSLCFLTGCTSSQMKNEIADGVLKEITGKDVSRNSSQCVNVRRACSNGNYEEWIQANAQKGCACN